MNYDYLIKQVERLPQFFYGDRLSTKLDECIERGVTLKIRRNKLILEWMARSTTPKGMSKSVKISLWNFDKIIS